MTASEYKEAIETVLRVYGDTCWSSITHSWDGKRILFTTMNNEGWYLVYFVKTHKIVKQYKDTWRTGKREVIYNGKD